MRMILALALLAASLSAHGGAYRPPPRGRPNDPFTPTGGGGPATARGVPVARMAGWEAWWAWNREVYLRTRETIRTRTVTTGRSASEAKDVFSRRALRENTLLPEMLRAITDRDEEVRTSAAVAIGKFRDTEHTELLKKVYAKDTVRQVREAALLGLLLMRDPSLKEFLRGLVQNTQVQRRERGMATLALGFIQDTEFLQSLLVNKTVKVKGSKSDKREIRACATLALGYCKSSAVAMPLAQASINKYEIDEVRGYAPCALARLDATIALPDMLRLIKRTKELRQARYGAAVAMGNLVTRDNVAVIDMLGKKAGRDRRPGVRTLLAISLGQIGGERAASYLVSGFDAADQRERGFYFIGAGLTKDADVGEILLKRFHKLSNNGDRSACAIALGLAGYRKAAPALMEEVEKGHLGFAPHGMVALGMLNEKKAIPLVQALLKDKTDPVLVREGALALALLRGSAASTELVAMLKEANTTWTRGSIAYALGFVGNEKSVEPLLEIYRDKTRQGEQRAIALAALGRIGDPDEIPLLATLAHNLNPYVVVEAVAEALTIL